MKDPFGTLETIDREVTVLEHIIAILEWDQETGMPDKALDERSEQQVLMQGLLHDKITASEIGDILGALGSTPERPEGNDASRSDRDKALIRLYQREFSRQSLLPRRLVEELAEATSRGHASWARSRAADDFSQFAPELEKIVALKREESDRLGYSEHPYDPLLDEYEPGMKTGEVTGIFAKMREDLVELLQTISQCDQVDDAFLYKEYPLSGQEALGKRVVTDMGYDWSRGGMAVAAHPFTTTLGRDDVRITTRYTEPIVSSPLFSSIHEAGHALYEMGASNANTSGTTLAKGVSLAMHESQSRLWENIIGRSKPFWEFYFPVMRDMFPEQLQAVDTVTFFKGINKVESSMIRVNADEVTYGLHIILRFELEKALISGELAVKDLPEAWNELFFQLLGVYPEKASEGVLQDVHWSAGLFGYFPTYALGNLFGAQISAAMRQSLPDVDGLLRRGELSRIHEWLREQVYQYGAIYEAKELLRRVTGEQLKPDYFSAYLKNKYQMVYNF